MRIKLTQAIKNELYRHAEEAYPEECCGFLFGKVIGEGREETRQVLETRRVPNIRERNRGRRFVIDPLDYRKAEDYAWQRDIDLLGIYHSHPDHPAEPSGHDRQSALPWFSYIIISVSKKSTTGTKGPAIEIRSWRLGEDRSFTEEIVAVESVTNDIPQTSAKQKTTEKQTTIANQIATRETKNYSESENNKETENNSMTKL